MKKVFRVTMALVSALLLMLVLAACKPRSFTVVFDSDGGTPVASLTLTEGEALVLPAPPTRGVDEFVGWYDQNDMWIGDGCLFEYPKGGTIELKARWKRGFIVSFDSDGGTAVADLVVLEGEQLKLPAPPTRGVDEFVGWYDRNDMWIGDGCLFAYPEDGRIELKAKWNRGFTVSFDSDGGTAVADLVVMEGEQLKLPEPPTRGNDEFLGWYDKNDNWIGDGCLFAYPESGTIELKAKWVRAFAVSYFDIKGGQLVAQQLYHEGDRVVLAEPPERVGWTFHGWFAYVPAENYDRWIGFGGDSFPMAYPTDGYWELWGEWEANN